MKITDENGNAIMERGLVEKRCVYTGLKEILPCVIVRKTGPIIANLLIHKTLRKQGFEMIGGLDDDTFWALKT